MNADQLVDRAALLIRQHRYPLAEETLRQAMIELPNHSRIHAYLALCMAQDRDRLPGAELTAGQAIHFAPDDPFAHFVMAMVQAERHQLNEALAAIDEALNLDPTDSSYHGLRAQIFMRQEKWRLALEAAESGLAHNPDSNQCSGIRSLALERLGRVNDALGEANRAIQRDPDSASAHASRGWALLNQGNHREAQLAFREALRLEPANEFARMGMINAINSGNFLFRWFTLLFQKISRLSSGWQMGLVLGAWLLMRFLNTASKSYPALEPWVLPLLGLYLLLVLMSWIMQPIFNTALRFHPFGKYLLSRKEKWASNLIAGTFLIGLVSGLAVAIMYKEPSMIAINLILSFQMTIPLSIAFNASAPWAKNLAIVIAIGFGVLFSINIIGSCFDAMYEIFLTSFLTGILLYSFAGQGLVMAKPRY